MIGVNEILCGDCVEIMKTMPDNCIDLTVTSPPYDNLRTYKGYDFDFEGIAKELYRVTRDGGVVVWVVGDATIKGSETCTSFRQALHFKEIGFNLHDTMIYAKEAVYAHDPRNKRYKQCFEYMFVFSKGNPNNYNEIKDRPNKHAGKIMSGSAGRNKEGVLRELKKQVIADFQARYNIWTYTTGGSITKDKFAFQHPAMFPERLAHDHIHTWTNEGDLIFDPMCGSGTTLKMAKLLNRNYIGIDISEEYCEISRKRVEITQ